jgi:hypothetical protein
LIWNKRRCCSADIFIRVNFHETTSGAEVLEPSTPVMSNGSRVVNARQRATHRCRFGAARSLSNRQSCTTDSYTSFAIQTPQSPPLTCRCPWPMSRSPTSRGPAIGGADEGPNYDYTAFACERPVVLASAP